MSGERFTYEPCVDCDSTNTEVVIMDQQVVVRRLSGITTVAVDLPVVLCRDCGCTFTNEDGESVRDRVVEQYIEGQDENQNNLSR